MTHDPLCYRSHDQTLGRDPFCQCAAIAKAREDERSNNFTPDDLSDAMTEAYQRGLDAAREAVAALRGCLGTDDNGDGTVWVQKFDALAAIDALKERR